MGQFTLKYHFDAPVETVFELGLDVYAIPKYMPWVSDIRDVRGRLDEVESGFTFTDSILGQKVNGTVEVVKVERPTLYQTLTKYDNGMQVRWTDRFTTTESGTDGQADIEYEIGPGIVQAVADRLFLEKLVERRISHAFENFKDLVEAAKLETVTA